MSAYVITDVEILDSGLYAQFLEKVTATVESHGGRFMARSSSIDVISGDWAPTRLAILEFDSREQVHTWLNSQEYTTLDDLRTKSSNINMVIVESR